MTVEHELRADSLRLAYTEQVIIKDLSMTISPGVVTSIVGANGCGKSTLLRSYARLLKPQAGQVLLDGINIRSMQTKAVARTIGLLPQTPVAPEGILVSDLVARGRHPHQGVLSRWHERDDVAVAEALAVTRTDDLADRSVNELSGGQRQRVWIAMALAQETDILLLDEPTTYLDLAHQVEVLDLLTDLRHKRGTTIVMVLHDLNLAARYSDQLVALRQGKIYAQGTPADVMTPEMVNDVFGLKSQIIVDPVSQTPIVTPLGRHHVK